MTTLTESTLGRMESPADTSMRVGGTWLAAGSLLLVVGFLLHPFPSPDPAEFAATVAGEPTRWVAAHGVIAVAMGVFAIAGLVVSTARSRLTGTWWTATAWAALVVAALTVMGAAIVEATAITQASLAGDMATFGTWSAVADVLSATFLVVLFAIAVIATSEARSDDHATPVWASWIGALAAVVAAVGMVAGFVLGFPIGIVVWLGGTVVTSLWTLWFGVVLARSGAGVWTGTEQPESGGPETAH